MQLVWSLPEFLQPYLCEVLQPWWHPHSSGSGERARGRGRGRGHGSRVTSVLWSRNGLVHDDRLAWIVAHVEAWRRRLRVSVATRGRRVRVLNHGVRCLVGGARIAWKTDTRIKELLSNSTEQTASTFENANKRCFTAAAVSVCGRWWLHRNDKCVRECVCVCRGNRSSHTANKLLISQAAAEEEPRNQTCDLQHVAVPQFCISLNSGFRSELFVVAVVLLCFLDVSVESGPGKQSQVFQQTHTGKYGFHRA